MTGCSGPVFFGLGYKGSMFSSELVMQGAPSFDLHAKCLMGFNKMPMAAAEMPMAAPDFPRHQSTSLISCRKNRSFRRGRQNTALDFQHKIYME